MRLGGLFFSVAVGVLAVMALFPAPAAAQGTCSGDDCGCDILRAECEAQCPTEPFIEHFNCIQDCLKAGKDCSCACCGGSSCGGTAGYVHDADAMGERGTVRIEDLFGTGSDAHPAFLCEQASTSMRSTPTVIR